MTRWARLKDVLRTERGKAAATFTLIAVAAGAAIIAYYLFRGGTP